MINLGRVCALTLSLVLVAPIAGASTVTFEAICLAPVDCDGDADFRFEVTLDASVVVPNTTYNASADSGASLTGIYIASAAGDGFSGPVTFSSILGVNGDLLFPFDASGTLTGIFDSAGSNAFFFQAATTPATGGFNWVNQDNLVDSRQDFLPVFGADGDSITVGFRRLSAAAVPTHVSLISLVAMLVLVALVALPRETTGGSSLLKARSPQSHKA
ncbi:MAG: hypothetical protein AAGI88_00015 [Pseudomonadota bacterium]